MPDNEETTVRDDKGKKALLIRISPRIYDELEAIARREERSRSFVGAKAIEQYVRRER